MIDPTLLTRPASEWFADALRQHVRENPGQIGDLEQLIVSGRARCSVMIELSEPPEIRCCWQIEGGQLVVFHRTLLRDVPGDSH